MAIYHLSVKAVSRSTGRSAPGAAAYRAGELLADNRTGEVFDYTRKQGVMSADVVLPEGAPEWAKDRNILWNAAEAAERRKDACVAREYEVALPYELTTDQRRELALSFARELAEKHGVAVDVCIHEPSRDGNEKNYHAHILTSTRVMGLDGLEGKAAIERAGRNRRADLNDTRASWAAHCNNALERAGLDVRLDHRSFEAQGVDLAPSKHIGVSAVGMERKGQQTDRQEIHDETRAENAGKIDKDPSLIIQKITQTQAVFNRLDMARELNRYIDDPQQFQNIMARLERAPELVELSPEITDGRRAIAAKYSTREMIETERAMVDSAERLAGSKSHGVAPERIAAAVGKYESLSAEQRAAIQHVTGAGKLSVIIGDAGTGKSFAMRVAKEAWEAEGFRVRGGALAGKAADELQAGSGIESRTIHSLEVAWNRGTNLLTNRDVLVIDEAGMVGSRQLGRVLEAAWKAGAKVVLLGDDKQLAAIEAGAGFRAITQEVGAAEITQIRRQSAEWAREASAEFARGDVRSALDAYNARGHVRMVDTRDDAKQALAADWLADREKGGTSIILAHANKDVMSLNATVREARKAAGDLGDETQFQTQRGSRAFAEGDRLVFLRNDKTLGVKNGTLGTVEKAGAGRLNVRTDDGRTVAFEAAGYNHIDHGYAVTVHKSQGVTVDRTYVLATGGVDRSLGYVGMTRHRDAATLYAGRDDFGSYDKLAKGIARSRPKESTLDFAERRGFDGAGVVSQWIERGRARLGELAERAGNALGRVLERAGRRDAPSMENATPEVIEAPRQPQQTGQEQQRPAVTPEEARRAAARTEVERAMGHGTPARDPLAGYRAGLDKAQQAGDSLGVQVAERRLQLAEEAQASGHNPAHLYDKLDAQAQADVIAGLQGQRPQARPEPTPEDAARAAARAEVEKAMGHGRKRDRGIEM